MKNKLENKISSEVLAAFIEGNASAEETKMILDSLASDSELRELLYISQSVDEEMGLTSKEYELIPMTAMAATFNEENYCCIECEKFILRKLNIEFDDNQLIENAISKGWQKIEGTALHNIGRHLEDYGLFVTRKYKSSIADIENALNNNESVIVAVDGGELLGNRVQEIMKDIIIGESPNHTVVVLSINEKNKTITIFDPNSLNSEDTYPLEQFIDAWNDSKNYLVSITKYNTKEYIPKPIDLSDIELSDDLNELREAIAENAHEVWALNRWNEGWRYGIQRDDENLLHPDMLPYSQLPEGEKEYDREMAMKTIKLLKKLGYDLIKYNDSQLYQTLKHRIQNIEDVIYCSKCGNLIHKHQKFCDNCGKELKRDSE